MKRIAVAVLTVCGTLIGMNNEAKAQVAQGSLMFDPYVGFPTANIWWAQVNDFSEFHNYSTVGSPVSFGGRLEYMLADNFGLGVDANYAIAGYRYDDPNFDTDAMGNPISGTYEYTSKKLRIMLRANYHFVQTEDLDVYVGLGAGWRNVIREFSWNDGDTESDLITLIPIAIRAAIGGRYYFHPNIGVNFELGLGGGGILQAGLALKI